LEQLVAAADVKVLYITRIFIIFYNI